MKKLAFGEKEISKVLAHVKPMQLKSGPYQAFSLKSLASNKSRLRGMGGEGLLKVHGPALTEAESAASHGVKIQVPKRGDATSLFKSLRGDGDYYNFDQNKLPLPKSSGSRRALDAVIKGHELAETQVKPLGSFHGHLSPDVILREHNMVTTLPAHLKETGDTMRAMRHPTEALDMYQHTGLNFGKSPRVSRHARKNLTKMMDEGVSQHNSRIMEAGVDMGAQRKILEERAKVRADFNKLGANPDSTLWQSFTDELLKLAAVDPSNTTLYADRTGPQQPKKPNDIPDMEGSDTPTSKLAKPKYTALSDPTAIKFWNTAGRTTEKKKLAWDGVGSGSGPISSTMARIDQDEKPDRRQKGDVPSRDGTSPGSALTVKHEDGRDFAATVPTAASTSMATSSESGPTTRM